MSEDSSDTWVQFRMVFCSLTTQQAMGYVDEGSEIRGGTPEAQVSIVVYSTKVLTLLALTNPMKRNGLQRPQWSKGQAADRRIKETELLMMLGQIAEKRGERKRAAGVLRTSDGQRPG